MDELEDYILEEDSAPFYQCLNGLNQKRWFTRETYFRNVLNVKLMDDDQYEELRTSKRQKKVLTGECQYDLYTQ